jgi:NAD(P)-dependent dehydrogenase (short-subunit alcohol dehydrogenase family)
MTEVAVVTGTSTGMGLHAAVELARKGLTVVATMRDTSRAGASWRLRVQSALTSTSGRWT